MRLRRRRRVYVDDLPATHDARFLVLLLLGVAAILGSVYGVGYVVAGDTVPSGTTVAGIRIGGMSRQQARAALREAMAVRLRAPIVVRAGTARDQVVPADAGVTFDVDATVAAALAGPDWDPQHMLAVLQGGGPVAPALRVNSTALAAALTSLGRQVSVAPQDASVAIASMRPVVRPGQPGQRLDAPPAARRLLDAVTAGNASVRVGLTRVPPGLDLRAARAFAAGTVEPALAGPVTVVMAGNVVRLPAARFVPALRVDKVGDRLRLGISADDLSARSAALLAAAPGGPVDARIEFRADRPFVVPGRPGAIVSRNAWATAVLTAATADPDRRVVARTTVSPPRFTTRNARALRIEALVAGATRTASPADARSLAIAARRLDGTVVLPGADFSFIATVGQAGALPSLAALGSALDSAASSGAMTVRRRLTAPALRADLTLRNDSVYPVYIRSWLGPGTAGSRVVRVELWSSRAAR